MFPGMNPKDVQKAMKKMGVKQEEIEATEVIIRTPEKNLVIRNPQVTKVDMMGQKTYQVAGEVEEQVESSEPEISDEDVQTVVSQASVSEDEARKTLEEVEGNIAEAILKLQQQ